ncbi:hypothetical protein ACM2TF_005644, partial [Pseudomonas aeruginosa]
NDSMQAFWFGLIRTAALLADESRPLLCRRCCSGSSAGFPSLYIEGSTRFWGMRVGVLRVGGTDSAQNWHNPKTKGLADQLSL